MGAPQTREKPGALRRSGPLLKKKLSPCWPKGYSKPLLWGKPLQDLKTCSQSLYTRVNPKGRLKFFPREKETVRSSLFKGKSNPLFQSRLKPLEPNLGSTQEPLKILPESRPIRFLRIRTLPPTKELPP